MTYLDLPQEVDVPLVADEAEDESRTTAADAPDTTRTVDVVGHKVGEVIVDDVFSLYRDDSVDHTSCTCFHTFTTHEPPG